ncbi:hypothetical protein [Lentzea aerocolonigenes]|uniref:hypothetical protein n=1 Tax=Lentzea aerocolonigenes TaxID=68170 RepID=UPI0004C37985|nr:hypothetical protein [Lentzea aerocolonigenes]MCP2250413.1 hypothetical protein [Lentzea aerocolonigenes]
MAITRWARRAVLTATALAFALPFTTGTAQADPIIEALADNNVNLTVGAYNNNVNSIPVSLGAGASLNTGSGITLGLDENDGIELAMDIGHAGVWAGASVGVPFTDVEVGAAVATEVDVPDVSVAVGNAGVDVALDQTEADDRTPVAAPPAAPAAAEPEPAIAAPPAPEATELVQTAVTITEDTAAVTEEPKGEPEEDDCPEEVRPHGCPNVTALGILSVCLLPNLVQLHI